MSLSERIRPGVEAAPWVIEEVRKLEAQVEQLRASKLEPPQFPTMLRKMWSGGEVQRWIDEHWNKA